MVVMMKPRASNSSPGGGIVPMTPSHPTDGTRAAAKEHIDKLIKSRLYGSRRGEEHSCVTVGFWSLLKMWEKIREQNLISTPPCLRNGEKTGQNQIRV